MNSDKKKAERPAGTGTFRRLSVSFAVLLLLTGAVYAGLYWERHTVIGEVRFSGHHFAQETDLHQSVELPIGMHPDSVHFGRLIETFQELPWILQAGIRVESGGRMVVDLQEREPLALLVQNGNRRYIDRNGVKMPVRLQRRADVPILHGFAIEPVGEPLDGDEFEQVREFLLAARDSRLGWSTVSEVGWHADEGVIALTQENGVKLIFGRNDFNEKMEHWDGFYSQVVAEKGIHSFSAIDLRFRNQIVTR